VSEPTWYQQQLAALRVERAAAMRKMRDDGFTFAQIGEAFEVSPQRVEQIVSGRVPRPKGKR
jgi:DNA-directed RNA polymerase sigma subunit (sigma70/sigma32)